jgi:hypothetical protein
MDAQQAMEPEVAPAPVAGERAVLLRGKDASSEWRIREPTQDQHEAIATLLRQRRRWRDVPRSAAQVSRLCIEILASLSASQDLLQRLAQAEKLEVVLEPDQAVALQFPWEYVIAEATRRYRQEGGWRRSLLICRYLQREPVSNISLAGSAMVIESAPGKLADEYSFESERKVVLSSLGAIPAIAMENPDRAQIRAQVQSAQPRILHFTGVDTRQGAELLGLTQAQEDRAGVFIKKDDDLENVSFEDMAGLLTSAAAKPALVSLNLYNSSPLAYLIVHGGAQAAIGFQDEIDDTLAELWDPTDGNCAAPASPYGAASPSASQSPRRRRRRRQPGAAGMRGKGDRGQGQAVPRPSRSRGRLCARLSRSQIRSAAST